MNMDFKPNTGAPRPMPRPTPKQATPQPAPAMTTQKPAPAPQNPTPTPAPAQTPPPPIPMVKDDEKPVKPPKPKFWNAVLKFIIKHKIILAIVTSIIAIAAILFSFLPIVSINNVIYTNLDTQFAITKDQTAKIRYNDVSLSINHFIDQSCPEGQECFGGSSVQAVEYNLIVNGKQHTINSTWQANSSGYDIKTVSSDYSSTVTVILSKSDS
jgi:hypothetical protein